MKLKDLTEQDIDAMSYDDLALMILTEKNKKMKINDLFKEVSKLARLSEDEYIEKLPAFFDVLSTDHRFIMLENGLWDLKTKHSTKVVIDPEDEEDIEEDIDIEETDDIEEDKDENIYADDDEDDLTDDDDDDPENKEQPSRIIQERSEGGPLLQIGNDVSGPQHDRCRHGNEMHRCVSVQDLCESVGFQNAPQHIRDIVHHDAHQKRPVIPKCHRHIFAFAIPDHIAVDDQQYDRCYYSYDRIRHSQPPCYSPTESLLTGNVK